MIINDVTVAGPMGRMYFRLPCGHQKASLSYSEWTNRMSVNRRCKRCRKRYVLTVARGNKIETEEL